MNGGKTEFILDTVILIDHLNAIAPATLWLKQNLDLSAITVITRSEVLAGTSLVDRPAVMELLDLFPCLEMTVDIADKAGEIRHKHKLKLPDAIQLSFAKIHGMRLITRNTKDFSPEQYKEVLIPYQY